MISHTSAGISDARKREPQTALKSFTIQPPDLHHSFCRKTTMTKHIRKEHPTEPIQDDQDAEYSDVDLSEDEGLEEDTEDIKEESRYQELIDTKGSQLTQSLSNYNKELWRLPSETTQRPTPLQLRSIHHSEISCRDIKLERTSSATSMRSMSSPYSDVPMSSEHPPIRADTIPGNLPIQPTLQQAITHSALPQQYQLRNHDNSVGLWSPQHSIQDSPTSVTNASPSSASTQSHGMFTSQPFQIPPTSLPSNEQMYPLHHDGIVLPIQQPMNDLAVHEIHLDQPQQDQYRDMASAPVHQQQYDGIPQHVAQEQYIDMSRDSSRHHSYSESQPQSAIHQYQGEVPPTPAPTQQLPYALPQQVPYQQPQLISIDNYNNTYYPPNGTSIQYPNNSMDWLEEIKPEDTWGRGDAWGQLPSQRIPGWP